MISTNTLIQEAIDMLCELHDSIANRSQYERCGRVISALHTALSTIEPESSNTPTLCLETPEEDMKPDYPCASLLVEIDLTFSHLYDRFEEYGGHEEKLIKPLQKALKHLNKALIILEGEDD